MGTRNYMSGHYTPFERAICGLTVALCIILFVMILGMAGEQEADLSTIQKEMKMPVGVAESAQ